MMMKGTLLILVILCASTFGMAPRHRSTRTTKKVICDPVTPCSWAEYKVPSKIVFRSIDNDYCVCGEGMDCMVDADDTAAKYYVYRCKPVIT